MTLWLMISEIVLAARSRSSKTAIMVRRYSGAGKGIADQILRIGKHPLPAANTDKFR